MRRGKPIQMELEATRAVTQVGPLELDQRPVPADWTVRLAEVAREMRVAMHP